MTERENFLAAVEKDDPTERATYLDQACGADASSRQRIEALLRTRRDRAVQRKIRLYLCSCCRLIWDMILPRCRTAVEVAERYADGMATRKLSREKIIEV